MLGNIYFVLVFGLVVCECLFDYVKVVFVEDFDCVY